MRKAFSFTEVLFAVMILGIGFIMVAAMFPVAIHQTAASVDDTIGASIGRQGASYVTQVASSRIWVTYQGSSQNYPVSPLLPTFPATGVLLPNSPFVQPSNLQVLPAGVTSQTIPGQVWQFNDARDGWGRMPIQNNPLMPQLDLLFAIEPYGSKTPPAIPHNLFLWETVSKNMIQASDPRYGWAALYKRDYIQSGVPGTIGTITPAPFAQVIFIGARCNNKPAYDPANDTGASTSPLRPTILNKCTVVIPTAAAPFATITFPSPSVTAENAYVVVSNDGLTGAYNGFIYRLGAAVNGSAMQYYFAPGQGPSATDTTLTGALLSVFVVGRGPDPTDPGALNVYSGAAQDVAAYTSYVQTP